MVEKASASGSDHSATSLAQAATSGPTPSLAVGDSLPPLLPPSLVSTETGGVVGDADGSSSLCEGTESAYCKESNQDCTNR